MGPRSRSLLWGASLLSLILCPVLVHGAVKPYITTEAEYNTECKTCPHSLCTNQDVYSSDSGAFNVTCWTRGTKIMGDNLWLKSQAGCYVTQYDVTEYEGDYTEDLAYCGRDSEEEHITTEDATLQYKTECRACLSITCDVAAYLPEDTDVTLTCWSPDGQVIIDDPYWLKTTNNCYVAQKNLYSKPDITYLDNCGPVPFLEIDNHFNENGTSEIDKRSPSPSPDPEPSELGAKYLINLTVGEEYSYCRSCPDEKCKVEKVYQFNQEVWLQCLVDDQKTNFTWWTETTDFCYTKGSDFWQDPADNYRFPLCEYFDNPPDDGGDKLVARIWQSVKRWMLK